jgi:hypothetical protein
VIPEGRRPHQPVDRGPGQSRALAPGTELGSDGLVGYRRNRLGALLGKGRPVILPGGSAELRAPIAHSDYQPGLLSMAASVRQRAINRGSAGPADPSCPHPGHERRKLPVPGKHEQKKGMIAMAPLWMAKSLVPITPALAGNNFLSDQQGEPRAARICGVPPALGSLAPACSWLALSVLQSTRVGPF